MKKLLLCIAVLTVGLAGLSAEAPDHFSFAIGIGGTLDLEGGDISVGNSMGFLYSFNESFGGGFSFNTINGESIDTVQFTLYPFDNASLAVYSGHIASTFGFGIGIGYNFFTKSDGLYTALGLFIDWFGGAGGAFDIADGGVLTFGLKTQIGI